MIPNVAEQNILILVEGKKYTLFWQKISRLARQKKIF